MSYTSCYPVRRLAAACLVTAGLIALTPTHHCHAQSNYSFAREVGTYQELQGTTPAPIGYGDSLYVLDLGGETFNFFGRPYAIAGDGGIQIAGAGFLRVYNDTSLVVIDGIFTELDSIDESSAISYVVEGAPGDRVLKVQWKNAGFKVGQPGDFTNFQIWLYQRSGMIEIRFGASAWGATSFPDGPWTGAFISPHTFAYMLEKAWITGDPNNPTLDTKKNFQFKKIDGPPAEGTIYRLTPTGTASVPTEGKEEGVLIYPNPAGDAVTVTLPDHAWDASVRVSNAQGTIVREQLLSGTATQVDLSALPAGLYLLEVSDGRMVHTEKIAKR